MANKIKVWFIKKDGAGYWTDSYADFLNEFREMSEDDKFEISMKELTKKEFKQLDTGEEFNGW